MSVYYSGGRKGRKPVLLFNLAIPARLIIYQYVHTGMLSAAPFNPTPMRTNPFLASCFLLAFVAAQTSASAQTDLALGKSATASSTQFGVPDNVTDGNATSRWGSNFTASEWIYLDLTTSQSFNKVTLRWESAYATGYRIQTSNTANGSDWLDAASITGGDGGLDEVTFTPVTARYVRMLGITRALTIYGYSLYSFEVYNTSANLALGQSATASSFQTGNLVANANDGSTTTRWAAADGSYPQWWRVDLGSEKSIGRVEILWLSSSTRAYRYKIETALSEASYSTVVDRTNNTTMGDSSDTFTATNARFVRVTVTGATAGFASAYEIRVYPPGVGSPPSITSALAATATVNAPFSYTITATNSPTSYNATSLPSWLTRSGAVLSGTPTSSTGSPFSIPIAASNADGSDTKNLILTVNSTPPTGNLAIGKTATASSTNGTMTAPKAIDGISNTRWQATVSDTEWIQVDLGQNYLLGKVVLKWEAAYGKDYRIQTSTNGTSWSDAAVLTNQPNTSTPIVHTISIGGTTGVDARFVRMQGVKLGTGYGYSLYEFEIYAFVPPPNQTTSQTIKVNFPVDGLAYASIAVSPVPTSVSPTPSHPQANPDGSFLVVQNPETPVTYNLTFPPNTTVTVTKSNFSSGIPLADLVVRVVDYKGDTLQAASVSTLAQNNANWDLIVITPPPNPNNPPANWITDPYVAPPPPAAGGSFAVTSPGNNALITDTRRPTFTWAASAGAVKYDLYINVTRTDYNWNAQGALLDRFTQVNTANITGTTFTLQEDLPDRWTYKWYVVATNGSGGTSRSDLRTFGLYIPVLETVADGISIVNGCRDLNKNGTIEVYEDWHNSPTARTTDLLNRMTPQQKAMQLFFNTQQYSDAGFGFGPFAPSDALTYQKNAAATPLGIPHIVLGDTIHGLKTSYPIQPALTATRDQQIAWEVSDLQRREMYSVGNRGTLSPLSEVGTKVLYPRIQEGGGEDADWVAGQVRAMVAGLQAGPELNPKSVLLTVKHWPSQGAGGEAMVVYDGTSIWYHMRPWHAAIEAGAACIMPGYSGSWLLNTAGRGAGDDPGILGFLRNNMGFQGLICTDWLPESAWPNCLAAGSDVMGGANPAQMGTFATTADSARLTDACRRVLEVKFRMGIFEDPYGGNVNGTNQWHTAENVALAYNAASRSITLLKNDGPLPLRLPTGSKIVVDGVRSDDPACMTTWTSGFHETDFGTKTFYNAIKDRAVQEGITVYNPRARTPNPAPSGTTLSAAIVIVGESYYTHGTWWNNDTPYLPDDPIGPSHNLTPGEPGANYDGGPSWSIIQNYRSQNIPTIVIVVLPRPYLLSNVLNLANALAVVYRPGDYGGPALADILWGDYEPQGRLPWQLPRTMSQIGGIVTADWQTYPDRWDLPFDMGVTTAEAASIKSVIAAGGSFAADPGYGNPLFRYGDGIQGFGLTDTTAPAAFTTLTPSNGQSLTGTLPAFTWQPSSDPQTGIKKYELYLDGALIHTTKKGTSYTLSEQSITNGSHSWYVKATNWAGLNTVTPTVNFTINDSTAPAAFLALSPAAGSSAAAGSTTTFYWEQSSDTGTGIKHYIMKLNGVDQSPTLPTAPVLSTANLALGKNAEASSTSFGQPRNATDGNTGSNSRWASASNDNEWWLVDLGSAFSIRQVVIRWEAAYGKDYDIEVSLDKTTWTKVGEKRGGTNGVHTITTNTNVGRYVRFKGITRGTSFGYSFFEFEVTGVGVEQKSVAVNPGSNNWSVRAVDGGNNSTNNNNGTITFTKQ